jgi:hypothetical protein
MFLSTTGSSNTSVGYLSSSNNSTGSDNVSVGASVLSSNTSGNGNVALGRGALNANTTASFNNAIGLTALNRNTTGTRNNAVGTNALSYNTTGFQNDAVGFNALSFNTTGSNNTALGYQAGFNLTTGSNNIAIAAPGVAGETKTTRIGVQGTQTRTFISGIRGITATGGIAVYVTSTGQLGTATSSRRYKDDIQSMGDVSDRLLQLRPVTFRYKQPDEKGNKPLQYGLIAEEVDAVLPDLVVHNDDGSVETVAYNMLPSMLLNVYQTQHQEIVATRERLAAAESRLTDEHSALLEAQAQIATMQAQITAMSASVDRLMAALPTGKKLAAAQ